MIGTIKRLYLDKNYGFIRSGNKDYFFHGSALKNIKIDDLEEGQEVTFEDNEGSKGPRAEDIFV